MIEALAKIEREVMAAAHRRATQRHSRRPRRVVVATVVLCLGAATAASAITGVGPFPTSDSGPSPLAPKTGGEATLLNVTDPTGGAWTARALRGTEGSLCVEAPPRPSPDTTGVCAGYDALASDFERFGLILNIGGPETGKASEQVHFIMGLARADSTAVRVIDQSGRERATKLSEAWATARPGDGPPPAGAAQSGVGPPPIRPSGPKSTSTEPIATRAFMLAASGPYPTEGEGIKLEVTLNDGRVLRSSWPSDYTP